MGIEGVTASLEKKSDLLQTKKDRNNYVNRTQVLVLFSLEGILSR